MPSSTRPLDKLVALQRADGSWEHSRGLAECVGIEFNRLQSARPNAIEDHVWATLVALAWLDTHAQAERLEWQGLAGKAETWLELRVPSAAIDAARNAANDLIRG